VGKNDGRKDAKASSWGRSGLGREDEAPAGFITSSDLDSRKGIP